MKKALIVIIILSALLSVAVADAANVVRAFTALTGGGTGALDKIAKATITDGDIGLVVTGNTLYFYQYNGAATDAESSPTYIRPDDYATSGVWYLVSARVAGLNTGRSTAPEFNFYDADATDSDVNGKIYLNCTDTGSGTEDCDLYFQVQKAGTLTTKLQIDSDGTVIFPDGGIDISAAEGITLSNDETITNGDNTEIAFNGTESLALDLDTGTANQVQWKNKTTGSTGVTDMSFSALNLATTGTIQGAVKINTDTNGMSSAEMTTAGMYGSMFVATGAGTWALPAAAAGMSFCIYSTTAAAIVVNPDDSDVITLNGTALSAGDSITSASGAGDFICLLAVSDSSWLTLGRSGTWTDTN